MRKIVWVSTIALGSLICLSAMNIQEEPKINYVPNEQTAIKVAEAIFIGLWGEAKVNEQKPFTATLTDSVWYVQGTVHGTRGGTMHMHLQASDCRIIDLGAER